MNEAELLRFSRRRLELNSQLDSARVDLDAWFEAMDGEISMTQIARLQGLLEARRDLLARLIELDDSFIAYLVSLRSGRQV